MNTIGLIALILGSPRAFGGHEVLERFRLRSCARAVCVAVDADESRRSPLDAAYVFKKARVEIAEPKDGTVEISRRFDVGSGYYDPKLGYLVLHGRPGGLINLETGRVTLLEQLVKRRAVLARNLAHGDAPRRRVQTRE